ncbi:hypothetical protein BGX34_003855, partial [Mortierella sp. NVP85]
MNRDPGGKNSYRARGMWYWKTDGHTKVKVPQSFEMPDGSAKGVTMVPEKRGIDGQGLKGKCLECPPQSNVNGRACCQAQHLSQQPDFKEQGNIMEEIVKKYNEGKIEELAREIQEPEKSEEQKDEEGRENKNIKKRQKKRKGQDSLENEKDQNWKEGTSQQDQRQDEIQCQEGQDIPTNARLVYYQVSLRIELHRD